MNELRDVMRAIVESVRFGVDDPRLALIAFAVLAALVGVVVVLVLVGQASWRARGERRARGLPVTDARTTIVTAAVVLVSLGLAFGLGARYLARPDVCARCHQTQHVSAVESSHAGVGCVSCHRQPGVLGFVQGQIDYSRWLLVTLRERDDRPVGGRGLQASVANRSCMRCHGAVASEVMVDNVLRVRHEDFLVRPCVECHNTVGHGETVRIPAGAAMNVCLTCHDARQVSAECGLCHVGDVAAAAQRSSPRAAPIRVATPTGTDCRGCHDTTSCNECHGTEMPHPPGWMPGHARPAFEQPDMCWRCHPGGDARTGGPHPYAMCNRCHRFPGPHGPTAEWVASHGAAAAKAPGVWGRTRCSLCHTNERFCDLCHEGRRERMDYQ